jgi:translocation and assembly module TamA
LSLAPANAVLSLLPGRRFLALVAAGVLSLASAGFPALAFELFGRKFFEANDETIVVPDAQPYTLDVSISGDDKALAKAIRNASSLVREEKRPPPGTAGLIARARGDYGRILASLYANGYYGGTIAISVDGMPVESLRPDVDLPDPAPVKLSVDPGPLFHFGEVRVLGLPTDALTHEDADALDLDHWDLKEGAVARSGAILATESRLVEVWRQRGHPKAAIVTREVIADHPKLTVDVTLAVEPGPGATFDAPLVTGTELVDPAYARFMTGIRPGEPYDPDTLARSRQRLQDLGVFASVSVVEGDSVGPDGILPLTFVLSERKRHLIGGGVSYATIDGATLEGYWMHRNLFGHAESLRFDAAISRIGANDLGDFSYDLATTFRRPGVFTPNTDATFRLSAERETVDTYESTTFAAKAGLDHRFSRTLTGSTAVNGEWADIDDAFGTNRYLIFSLPSKLDYDSRDIKLDPTEGLHAIVEVEPFTDINAGTLALVTEGTLAGYYGIGADDRLVLAARGSLGTIVGGDTEDIPATRRFYLGGGGSIRGYEYRSVGPESGGEVIGGLSFFETSLEARFRLTDSIGIVPFIDAGAAYEDPIPSFSEDVRVGVGLGLRYLTPLGPLRFDVAVPLNRDGGDSFAFYVGLGQSF